MNIKLGLWSLTITSAFLLMASCSGSSESNDNSAGSSGSAGKATGGTSNSTAGTSNSTGGTGNATAGTSNSTGGTGGTGNGTGGTRNNNGGTTANGGFAFGGNFNFGGAGFDPADFACMPKPTVGAACAAGTQPCADGTDVCYCQNMKWACLDLSGFGDGGAGPGGGFGQLECPAEQPMMGEACDGVGFCPYGQNKGCACYNNMWMCN